MINWIKEYIKETGLGWIILFLCLTVIAGLVYLFFDLGSDGLQWFKKPIGNMNIGDLMIIIMILSFFTKKEVVCKGGKK